MVYRPALWIVRYCRKDQYRTPHRFIHGFHLPLGALCACPLILALPLPYRYGAVVQFIGSLLAGPDSTPQDADRFAQDYFSIKPIAYWCSPHGPLPVVDYSDLQSVARVISLPTSADLSLYTT